MMLARVADSLYWIGRYIERAEHLSRLSDIMLTATLDQSEAASQAVHIALAAVGEQDLELTGRTPFDAARNRGLEREDTGSVLISLARARENARQVRDQITTETWERLNILYLRITDPDVEDRFAGGSAVFLQEVIADLHLFKGAADATMSHGEGWRFLLLGVYLERAQLIARLLDISFGEAASKQPVPDHLALMSLLRMACALEPYLRVYTADIQPRHILEFLLFDEEFPRSIRFATARIEEHLKMLTRHAGAVGRAGPERLAGRLSSRLECAEIHEAIYETFVAYPLEQRLPA
jgi:uncharacterized alpha-E superfamily protein